MAGAAAGGELYLLLNWGGFVWLGSGSMVKTRAWHSGTVPEVTEITLLWYFGQQVQDWCSGPFFIKMDLPDNHQFKPVPDAQQRQFRLTRCCLWGSFKATSAAVTRFNLLLCNKIHLMWCNEPSLDSGSRNTSIQWQGKALATSRFAQGSKSEESKGEHWVSPGSTSHVISALRSGAENRKLVSEVLAWMVMCWVWNKGYPAIHGLFRLMAGRHLSKAYIPALLCF